MVAAKAINQRKRRASATKGRLQNRPYGRSSKAKKANYQQKVAAMKVLAFYILDLPNQGRERRGLIRAWKNHIRNYWRIVEAWTATHKRLGKDDKKIKNMLDFVWDQIKAGKNVQDCLTDLKQEFK